MTINFIYLPINLEKYINIHVLTCVFLKSQKNMKMHIENLKKFEILNFRVKFLIFKNKQLHLGEHLRLIKENTNKNMS